MTKEQVSKYFSRLGKRGMAKRWKNATKAEKRAAVQAALDARKLMSKKQAQELVDTANVNFAKGAPHAKRIGLAKRNGKGGE